MKANLPRRWESLSPLDKKRIEELKTEEINRSAMIMLDIFLKMSCQVLHGVFGMGEKRLNDYLGTYRRLFARNVKMVKAGTQIAELDRQMNKIFKKDGYPDEFFRMMFSDWDIDTSKGAENE